MKMIEYLKEQTNQMYTMHIIEYQMIQKNMKKSQVKRLLKK